MTKEVRPEDVVRGILDPKQACEALTAAGFFPAGFFETGKRFFFPRYRDYLYPLPHPSTVSEILFVLHGLPELLMAEELARETLGILADLHAWWHENMVNVERFPTISSSFFIPDIIVWGTHFGRELQPLGSGGWCPFQIPREMLRLAGFPGAGLPQSLPELYELWENGENRMQAKFTDPRLSLDANEKILGADGIPLNRFPNPFRPSLDMMRNCRHGVIESGSKGSGDDFMRYITIGFNVW